MADLKNDFREWLIKQGLSEKTTTRRQGTVYEYIRRIEKICNTIYAGHNLQPWQQLAEDIYPILGIHTLCKKGSLCITQDNLPQIKSFFITLLSNLRTYQENFSGLFTIELLDEENFLTDNYTLIKDLLPYLSEGKIIIQSSISLDQLNKNRNVLEKFYFFLADTKYVNLGSSYYKKFAEQKNIEDFYTLLEKKLQTIKSFISAPYNILEILVEGGNATTPPLFKESNKDEKKVSAAWVCALLCIERHTLTSIAELTPILPAKRSYRIKDVNNFINKHFVASSGACPTAVSVKKWWTVRETIKNTGLDSKRIQRLRTEKKVYLC